jgi:prepilin-type N-terminal cleavage/methylation domain-containing protein
MKYSNKHGFTLVEVLVTLLILAVGMLASMVGIMKALDHSLMSEMRNDAIKIAQEQQEAVRNMNYNAIPQIPASQTIWRQVRKTSIPYTVTCTLPPTPPSAFGLGARAVDFNVQWTFKNTNYSCDLRTIVRQTR